MTGKIHKLPDEIHKQYFQSRNKRAREIVPDLPSSSDFEISPQSNRKHTDRDSRVLVKRVWSERVRATVAGRARRSLSDLYAGRSWKITVFFSTAEGPQRRVCAGHHAIIGLLFPYRRHGIDVLPRAKVSPAHSALSELIRSGDAILTTQSISTFWIGILCILLWCFAPSRSFLQDVYRTILGLWIGSIHRWFVRKGSYNFLHQLIVNFKWRFFESRRYEYPHDE